MALTGGKGPSNPEAGTALAPTATFRPYVAPVLTMVRTAPVAPVVTGGTFRGFQAGAGVVTQAADAGAKPATQSGTPRPPMNAPGALPPPPPLPAHVGEVLMFDPSWEPDYRGIPKATVLAAIALALRVVRGEVTAAAVRPQTPEASRAFDIALKG